MLNRPVALPGLEHTVVLGERDPFFQAWLLDSYLVDDAIPNARVRHLLVFDTTELDALHVLRARLAVPHQEN